MRNAICGSVLFSLLSACSSMPVSEQIAEQAKSDLRAVESIISELGKELPAECDISLKSGLELATEQIKEVDIKITSAMSACKTEKQVLKEKIGKRDRTIVILVIAIILMIIVSVKKKF